MRLVVLRFFTAALCAVSSAFALAPFQLTPPDVARLAAGAEATRSAPIVTVVDKPQAGPSGDAHDYVSYARYYWPNPDTKDGLPYVSRDGQHNEAQVAKGDHERLWSFFTNVEALAAAWEVRRDAAAAKRAGDWLRAWFINPATRMTPHLEFAQVRLGHDGNHGSSFGVIDARGFAQVVDALRLLHDSPAFSREEEAAIQHWFTAYLDWLTTSKNALEERAAERNHGTWYLAQTVAVARLVGRDDLARALCESDKARIARQIEPDGSQPGEIRRADGLGYSVFNLRAHAQVARLAAGFGIDLWNFQAPSGASLRQALHFLEPYNRKPEIWPHTQNAKLKPGFLDELLAEPDRARTLLPESGG